MTELDTVIVIVYLLAIFTTVVKQKANPNLYRALKLFVVLTLVLLLTEIFRTRPTSFYEWSILTVKVVPLFLLFIIIVQTEARLIMKQLGIRMGLLRQNAIEDDVKVELVKSIDYLSAHKIGALITFERNIKLDEYVQHAFQLEAALKSELMTSIFYPNTPLHDGAVIIRGSLLVAAGAYFPPSEDPEIPKSLGSRHRAAIGISEVTDALTIIVSEQTGQISIAIDGYLDKDISKESLILYLEKYLQT